MGILNTNQMFNKHFQKHTLTKKNDIKGGHFFREIYTNHRVPSDIWVPFSRDMYMYTRRQPSYSDSWSCTVIKSVLTSFRRIHTHCFLHKYIVRYRNFIYMQSSMFSFTLLIDCTTSDVAVRWLSSSVPVTL